jgi:preprotein translocase subunit YajC
MLPLLFFGLVLVAFYALILRPQRRQVLAHRALVASLEVGDEIITSGGVYGIIRSMDEAVLGVEIAPGVTVRVARHAVASRAPGVEDAASGPAAPDTVAEDTATGIDGTAD